MKVSDLFGGIALMFGVILLVLVVGAIITFLAGGIFLAFWNLWAMLGWLPAIPTSQWIAAMIFFSIPGYIRALASLANEKD